jgi:hypothetical protein
MVTWHITKLADYQSEMEEHCEWRTGKDPKGSVSRCNWRPAFSDWKANNGDANHDTSFWAEIQTQDLQSMKQMC